MALGSSGYEVLNLCYQDGIPEALFWSKADVSLVGKAAALNNLHFWLRVCLAQVASQCLVCMLLCGCFLLAIYKNMCSFQGQYSASFVSAWTWSSNFGRMMFKLVE